MSKPFLLHLKSSKSLETPYEAVRAGFVSLALEKNRRATPFVAQARALKAAASKAKSPADLLKIPEIQSALLTAAGVSDKAVNHLQDADKREAVNGLIKNFLEPAGVNFVEELVFRFLLTRGDTLGGSMRNIGGFMAQKKLTRAIIAYLKLSGHKCKWLHGETNIWAELPENDADVELSLRGLSWGTGKGPRTLLYNVTVPFFRNNVDLSLFKCAAKDLSKKIIETPSAYIALGELKGGIDPAGADEHWKTARTALNRIHEAFKKHKLQPHTFFIGAAIEAKMAKEIWEMLKNDKMENAANLTDEDQIASITSWLCSL
ncbi:MAG: type II restriction endonuclease [candidate division Zixibacteria bacterium]|nr:type II restriction endonuclease [candidate division Zixibacteria bacterium]MCI0595722.1 type II restriction endonuclease [candidate division Zixibacteria bacterium]